MKLFDLLVGVLFAYQPYADSYDDVSAFMKVVCNDNEDDVRLLRNKLVSDVTPVTLEWYKQAIKNYACVSQSAVTK